MLTRILFIGVIAGAAAGTLAFAVQAALMQPLIIQAEALESAGEDHGAAQLQSEATAHQQHSHDEEEPPPDPGTRQVATAIALASTGIGYGLILSGVLALTRRRGWRAGLMLGVIGFASVQLAPALGTTPVPPGVPNTALHARQLWWLLAATCTGCALLLGARSARKRHAAGLALAVGLLVLPQAARHWIFELGEIGPAPEMSLPISPFALTSFATAAVLWLCLGAVAGAMSARVRPLS
jgi:cobalt transporter subunit CbtA